MPGLLLAVMILLTLVVIVLTITARPGALLDELSTGIKQDEESENSEEETNVVEGSLEEKSDG